MSKILRGKRKNALSDLKLTNNSAAILAIRVINLTKEESSQETSIK